MYDPEDLTDFIMRQLWVQVQGLAEKLADPRYVYVGILDDMVACLQAQQLPGKDVSALLCEVLRSWRDQLLQTL